METPSVEERDPSMTVLDTWRTLTASALRSARATNQAFLAPIRAGTALARATTNGHGELPPSIPSLSYEEGQWEFERTVDEHSQISVGDSVRFTKRINEEDVESFARVSGDTSRLHLDDRYAERTRFGTRIAHGTLVSGMISAALARLPGLTIYLSQDLEFVGPVRIDTELTADVEVVEALGNGQFRLTTTIEDDAGDLVIDGEAIVLVDPVD